MKIVLPLRQCPDLVEELEIASDGKKLEEQSVRYILNEIDSHALEEAVIFKEKYGAHVSVVTIDIGDADNILFTAAAKGVDRIIKIKGSFEENLNNHTYATILTEVLKKIPYDMIIVGCQAVDDLDGQLGVILASYLDLPYIGVVKKIEKVDSGIVVTKELPDGLASSFKCILPIVIGVLSAEQPPRYVPISKLRSIMKTAKIEEITSSEVKIDTGFEIIKMHKPETGKGAEMIEGSPEEIVAKLMKVFKEKGILK